MCQIGAHESETASFHEADCLHPSETIACERRRDDLDTGWAAWLWRRQCIAFVEPLRRAYFVDSGSDSQKMVAHFVSWFSLFLSSSLQVSVRPSPDQSLYARNDVTWREVQVKWQARGINLRSGRMMLRAKPYSVGSNRLTLFP